MKRYVFIVIQRERRYLLERRGEFLGFHDVEVRDGETEADAIRRGYEDIALVYMPQVSISDKKAHFVFRGDSIEATFVIVKCLRAIPRPEFPVSFDYDLTHHEVDEIAAFYDPSLQKTEVCAA